MWAKTICSACRSQPRLATTWEKASSAASVGLRAGEHGRLRVLRPGRGRAGERLLAGLAGGLVGDHGVEVGGARQADRVALGAVADAGRRRGGRRAPGLRLLGDAARFLGGAEDVLLGVGAVRHLGGDVEPLGEQRGHRLVVGLAGRLLGAAGGDRPERPGEQARAARAAHPRVRVEVVAVGAEDAGEAVGRVGDLDLHPGQARFEEALEEARAGRLAGRAAVRAQGLAAGQRRLEPVLFVAVDEVVVVVAGEEDEALAGQLLARSAPAGRRRSRPRRRPSRRGSRRGRRAGSPRRRRRGRAPGARGRSPRAGGRGRSRRRSACRR